MEQAAGMMQLPHCTAARGGSLAFAENTSQLLYCDGQARAWKPVVMPRGLGPIDPPKASFGAGLGLGVLMGLLIALALVGMGRNGG